MPKTLTSVDELQEYLTGVMGRANHHAEQVSEVILALAGAVVLFREPGTELKARVHAEKTANILSFEIGGKRYALAYNHANGSIEVRGGSHLGKAIDTFTNASTAKDVLDTFKKL